MHDNGPARSLANLIKPYGLRVVGGDHRKIVNEAGRAVYWFSGSPSSPYFAENTLRDLAKAGLIPRRLKRLRIRN